MVSLENEYFTYKKELEYNKKILQQMLELDEKELSDDQITSRRRLIKRSEEDIEEIETLLVEVKSYLIEAINSDGEVSEIIKKELNYWE